MSPGWAQPPPRTEPDSRLHLAAQLLVHPSACLTRAGQAPVPTAQGLAGNLRIGMTLLEGLSPFSARPSQEIVNS